MNLFLTGVTGFLGGELLVELLKNQKIKKIFCLVRAGNVEEAVLRLRRVVSLHGDLYDEDRIVPIVGDLSRETLSDELSKNDELKSVNMVIHAAANTSFSPAYKKDIQRVNINGANMIFDWASTLSELETFVYIGTAWICGSERANRIVYEDESPNISSRQLVEYCRSKLIGEMNVRKAIPAEKLLVVRPATIMGDSRNWIPRSYVIMWAIAVFDMMRLVAMNPESPCDIIPIDYASKAITNLIFCKRKFNTYHISGGVSASTNMGLLLNAVKSENGPPFGFVNYEMIKHIKLLSKGKLKDHSVFNNHLEYLDYWKKTFGTNGNIRILLSGVDYYFQFVNLGLIFDNSRLLNDTGDNVPEPAHIYMARNKWQLQMIDIMEGAVNP